MWQVVAFVNQELQRFYQHSAFIRQLKCHDIYTTSFPFHWFLGMTLGNPFVYTASKLMN